MHWTDDWIGLPYALRGRGPAYDCWGLWRALTEARRGVTVPASLTAARRGFSPAEDVEEGDLLLFRAGGRPLHVGYALDGRRMLHIQSEHATSAIDDYRRTLWAVRLEGIYRYAA